MSLIFPVASPHPVCTAMLHICVSVDISEFSHQTVAESLLSEPQKPQFVVRMLYLKEGQDGKTGSHLNLRCVPFACSKRKFIGGSVYSLKASHT